MTLLRRVEAMHGQEVRAQQPGTEYGPSNIPLPFDTNGMGRFSEAQAMAVTTVATCISILTDSVSMLPIHAYRRTTDRSRKMILPEPKLITDPWPEGIQEDWMTQVTYSLASRGNSYCLAASRDPLTGYPTSLMTVHADNVSARRVNGVREYRVNGNTVPLADMVHIPSALLPPGEFVGLNPIEYARSSWRLAASAETYGIKFFDNSANPSGVLEIPGNPDRLETLRIARDFKLGHQGLGMAQMPAVLTGGATWNQMSLTMDDAQFLMTRDFQRQEIASWFRIPSHMLGQQDKTSSWGTGIEQMSIGFVINTLMPYLSRIEGYLSKLLPGNQQAKFDLRGRLRGDTLQRYQSYVLAFQNGFLTINEIRELEDMPPLSIPQGDKNYGPLNFAPLDAPKPKPVAPPKADPNADPAAVDKNAPVDEAKSWGSNEIMKLLAEQDIEFRRFMAGSRSE